MASADEAARLCALRDFAAPGLRGSAEAEGVLFFVSQTRTF